MELDLRKISIHDNLTMVNIPINHEDPAAVSGRSNTKL